MCQPRQGESEQSCLGDGVDTYLSYEEVFGIDNHVTQFDVEACEVALIAHGALKAEDGGSI